MQGTNEKNEIRRGKAIFVVQGFSQRCGVDYDEKCQLVKDEIKFRYSNYTNVTGFDHGVKFS